MSNRMEKTAWKAVGAGGAIVAGLAARKLLTATWTKVRKTDSPSVSAVPDKAAKLAVKAQAKGLELAAQAQAKGSELATQAQRRSGELASCGLRHLGERLSQGRLAQLLEIQPCKRRLSFWSAALLGVAGGYAIALLTASKAGAELRGKLASWVRSGTSPRVEMIRSTLSHDPRTAMLPDLNVTVVDSSVVVQGTVPPGFDQDALRQVIARVPGVHGVDLRVAVSA